MTLLEFIVSFGQIISVVLIPFIMWGVGIKYQNRKAKKDAQLSLFLTLMANRKSSPVTKEWVDALNTIDVVFQDNRKVRQAWREYLDSLNERSPDFDNNNSFRLDLLSEMAISLGYKNLKQTEIDRFYLPKCFDNDYKIKEAILQELLRILQNSSNINLNVSAEDSEPILEKTTVNPN